MNTSRPRPTSCETLDVVIGRKLNRRAPLVLKCPDALDDARFSKTAS